MVKGRTIALITLSVSHWPMVQPSFHQRGTAARTAPTTRTHKRVDGMALPGWHGIALADRFWSSSAFGAADGCRWRLGLSIPTRNPENLVQAPARVTNQRAEQASPHSPARNRVGICRGCPRVFPGLFRAGQWPRPASASQAKPRACAAAGVSELNLHLPHHTHHQVTPHQLFRQLSLDSVRQASQSPCASIPCASR